MRVAKINVVKIPKESIFVGKKGKYIDIVLMENQGGPDQYGNDGFVAMSVSKEDRLAGKKGVIIGDWKRVGGKKAGEKPKPAAEPETDDVPF